MKVREKDQHITIKRGDLNAQLAEARKVLIPGTKSYRNKGRYRQEYDRNLMKRETRDVLEREDI